MFTGIVEDIGTIDRVHGGPSGGKVLAIRTSLDPSSISLGDSIAINGVCLTVTTLDGPRFTVDAGPETLDRTTTGNLRVGHRVNLERALAVGDRLGGHLVQGHVDGVGTIRSVSQRENAWDVTVSSPADLMMYIAPRGSITVDGISLTVTGVETNAFGLSIIPHTWKETTLIDRKVGSSVNLEIDVLARYVARILDVREGKKPGLSEADLRRMGY